MAREDRSCCTPPLTHRLSASPAFPRSFVPVLILLVVSWISPVGTLAENCAEYNCFPIIGSAVTQGSRGVVVANGFAYVADGPAGLRVIDVSDPTSPVTVGKRSYGPRSRCRRERQLCIRSRIVWSQRG